MQLSLLEVFFENIIDEGKEALSYNWHSSSILGWKGVILIDGMVNTLQYDTLDIGNFNIHAAPPSTMILHTFECHQRYSVETRMLPRMLAHLSIYRNAIYGTLDLTNLPLSLQDFRAYENAICGPIVLTHLPAGLKTLDLSLNNISQKVVWYGNLPRNIETILLVFQTPKSIAGVRAISPQDKLSKEVAKNVFKGMSHK